MQSTEKGITLIELLVGLIITGTLGSILVGFVLAPLGKETAEISAKNYVEQAHKRGQNIELVSCLAFDNDGDGTITCTFDKGGIDLSLHCESGLLARLVGGSCKPPR
jgi:type II secretory pathway pseudopilin PulG